jgi:hypothetical protein
VDAVRSCLSVHIVSGDNHLYEPANGFKRRVQSKDAPMVYFYSSVRLRRGSVTCAGSAPEQTRYLLQ